MRKLINGLLARLGSGRFVYVDVGAMGGVEPEWRRLEGTMTVLGFEPDDREFAKLTSDSQTIYLNKALWRTSEDLTYHISKEPGKSSFLEPDMAALEDFPDAARYQVVDTTDVPAARVTTLDEATSGHNIAHVDFVKLDTQGTELAVLEGAQRCLRESVLGLKVEVEFVRLYKDQPLFSDVDRFVPGFGFRLMDLRRTYWRRDGRGSYLSSGQLVFGDALYLKDPGQLIGALTGMDGQHAQDTSLRYVLICLVYGYTDLAIAYLRKALDAGILAPPICAELTGEIRRGDASFVALLRSGGRILKSAHRLFRRRVLPHSLDWAGGDPYPGNPPK